MSMGRWGTWGFRISEWRCSSSAGTPRRSAEIRGRSPFSERAPERSPSAITSATVSTRVSFTGRSWKADRATLPSSSLNQRRPSISETCLWKALAAKRTICSASGSWRRPSCSTACFQAWRRGRKRWILLVSQLSRRWRPLVRWWTAPNRVSQCCRWKRLKPASMSKCRSCWARIRTKEASWCLWCVPLFPASRFLSTRVRCSKCCTTC
mmetsp:Transcript_16504/g.62765  ORF Transcript_16504/g.62765 Transcript_16504/m.62765 type:complete len:209 (-) Transcript_16504:403-1029(-)